jgi:glyoxylase-like metal-dependent hydrolase (beta-lactamase superfamily II)
VSHQVTLEPLTDAVVNVAHRSAGEVDVRATVLLGERWTLVFDTLYGPRDMTAVLGIAEERRRPVLIINSHADEDHAWGNCAFPVAPVVAQRECRERFFDPADVAALLKQRLAEDRTEFEQVVLRPPDITFERRMSIDAGGFTVNLWHLPGHKRDCIVAHVPEWGLFLGGDTIEDPFPLLVDGPRASWAASLRGWASRDDVKTVVPSHGPVGDTALLVRNAEYLEGLVGDRVARSRNGLPQFYLEADERNRERAKQLAD